MLDLKRNFVVIIIVKLQVAIKKMKKKYYSWEECVNLREVKVLHLTYLPGALIIMYC